MVLPQGVALYSNVTAEPYTSPEQTAFPLMFLFSRTWMCMPFFVKTLVSTAISTVEQTFIHRIPSPICVMFLPKVYYSPPK